MDVAPSTKPQSYANLKALQKQALYAPSRKPQHSPFRDLPVEVAEEISFFANAIRIETPEDLRSCLRWHPILCISLIMEPSKAWQIDSDSLRTILEDSKDFRLDVTLSNGGDVTSFRRIAPVLSSLPQVVSLNLIFKLGVYCYSSTLESLERSANEYLSIYSLPCPEFLVDEILEDEEPEVLARLLANAPVKNLHLNESALYLGYHKLVETSLADSLKLTSKCLKYLWLRETGIDSKGAALLGKALETHESLELLDLCCNSICDEGAVAIADCLSKNCKLSILLLADVDMTSIGGVAVAQSLRSSRSNLSFLELRDDLGTASGQAFASMLLVNQTLYFARFEYCNFGEEGCKNFIKTLQTNRTLKELSLNGCHVSDKDKRELTRVAREAGILEILVTNDINELTGQPLPDSEKSFREAHEEYYSIENLATHYVKHRMNQEVLSSQDERKRMDERKGMDERKRMCNDADTC